MLFLQYKLSTILKDDMKYNCMLSSVDSVLGQSMHIPVRSQGTRIHIKYSINDIHVTY